MPLSRDQWLTLVRPAPHEARLSRDQWLELVAHPKHVATEAGVKKFHEPIGALIIAHPKLKAGDTSKKLVYVSGVPYAIPVTAKVYVSSLVDVHDDADLNNAGKVIDFGGGKTPWVIPGGGEMHEASDVALGGLTLLAGHQLKKPVYKEGKLAGWVPQDWKVYHHAKAPGPSVWIRSPDGAWYAAIASGPVEYPQTTWDKFDKWAKQGDITLVAPPGTELAEGIHPPAGGEGFEPATILVPKKAEGGTAASISVNQHQIAAAVEALHNAKSTNVKPPLAKAGSPLADMDYLGIAKAHLATHPELKIPKGSKKEHAGHTKHVIVHYLGEKHEQLAATDALTAAALQHQQAVEAEAAHAQQLTPATGEVGGITVTKHDIEEVIGKLESKAGTHGSLKTALKGTKLEGVDYFMVAAAHKKAFHKGENTKTAFLHALQSAQGELHDADATSGHDDSAELDALISDYAAHDILVHDNGSAIAQALVLSHKNGVPYYASTGFGQWAVSQNPSHAPSFAPSFYKATPEHTVTFHMGDSPPQLLTAAGVLEAVKPHLSKPPEPAPHLATPELEVPPPKFKKSPYAGIQLWKQVQQGQVTGTEFLDQMGGSPEGWRQAQTAAVQQALAAWSAAEAQAQEPEPPEPGYSAAAKLDKLITDSATADWTTADLKKLGPAMAYALKNAAATGETAYVSHDTSGWYITTNKGNVSSNFYTVFPDHSVISQVGTASPASLSVGAVLTIVADHFPAPGPVPHLTTPEQHYQVGNNSVTKAEVQAAIGVLQHSHSYMVLPTLQEAGSPLGAGTWPAFKEWATAGGNKPDKEHFIAWLQEAIGGAAPEPGTSATPHGLGKVIKDAALPSVFGAHSKDWALAYALKSADEHGTPRYTYPEEVNGLIWHVYMHEPVSGTFGASAGPYITVHSDHSATLTSAAGDHLPVPGEVLEAAAEKWLKPAAEAPAEPEASQTWPLVVEGALMANLPPGSEVYQFPESNSSAGTATHRWVKYPDGTWWGGYVHNGAADNFSDVGNQDENVTNGVIVKSPGQPPPLPGQPTAASPAAPAEQLKTLASQVYALDVGGAGELRIKVAKAIVLATETGSVRYVVHSTATPGLWLGASTLGGLSGEEYYQVSAHPDGGFSAYHQHPEPGGLEVLSFAQVKDLLTQGAPQAHAPDMEVLVEGKVAGHAPAGSKIYYYSSINPSAANAVKYAQFPDGSWHFYGKSAEVNGPTGQLVDHEPTTAGGFTEVTLQDALEGALAKEDAAPSGPDLQVISPKTGLIAGSVPAGSKFYKPSAGSVLTPSGGTTFSAGGTIYVKQPDGEWKETSYSGGLTHSYSGSDTKVADGQLVEVPPPPAAELAEAQAKTAFQASIQTAAVQPGPAATWQQAAAKYYTGDGEVSSYSSPLSGSFWVYPADGGGWKSSYWAPTGLDMERYRVTGVEAAHFPPGVKATETGLPEGAAAVPFSELEQAVQYLVPNAVVVSSPAGKKLLTYGAYVKPKGGKGWMEVTAPKDKNGYGYNATHKFGSGARASYIYHPFGGGATTEKTATAAANWLANATYAGTGELSGPVPKTGPAKLLTYITTPEPGTYTLSEASPWPGEALIIKPDGSALVGLGTTAVTVTLLLEHGDILDTYGNTAVEPGTQPAAYHLFGAAGYTRDKLSELLGQLEVVNDDKDGTIAVLKEHLPQMFHPGAVQDKSKAFFDAHQTGGWQSQRDAIAGLVRELLDTPTNTAAKPAGPSYLKTLPPGIHSPQDIFEFTDTGLAAPFGGQWPASMWSLASKDLAAIIKEVSAQYGDGKVVGTHPSGLAVAEKGAWLAAWQAGDMPAVFALDAKSGKVSPAHPGAPSHPETHSITWAPWGKAEVPAGKAVPGEWTSAAVPMPKAEIANYLIKAGLNDAEYLTDSERRQWVTAHRQHDQQQVDALSKQAAYRWESGAAAVTEVPHWTDDIKPAKSYDVYLEEKSVASNWPGQAMTDFQHDHPELLQPFLEQQGYAPDSPVSDVPAGYGVRALIQLFLDDLAAREEAERLRPRYSLVTGDTPPLGTDALLVKDQFGKQYVWRQPSGEDAARELAAYTLARMWGFRSPPAQPITLEDGGIAGIGQQFLPGSVALADIGIPALSDRQVSDLAAEHVLDWALDNPDGHPSNYLITADGALVGIDKDGAWSHPGAWDGTGPGIAQYATSAAGQLLDAVRHHQLSQEQSASAATSAIRTAYRMSKLTDSHMMATLEPVLGHDLAAAAVERKNALPVDIEKMWAAAFKDAKWQLPKVELERLSHGLHSGFMEPTYADHVMAAKSFGVPAFFAGTELEDGHLLTWTELAGDARLMRGEGHVLEPHLAKLVTWLKAHETGHEAITPASVPQVGHPPGEDTWYQGIVSGAKAVSRVNGNGGWPADGSLPYTEGGYTAKQLGYFDDAKAALGQARKEAQEASSSGESSMAWADYEKTAGIDPATALDALKHYQGLVDKVETAKGNGGTFAPGDLPKWVPPPPKPGKAPEPPKPAASDIKVVRTGSVRDLGSLDLDGDHEVHLNGNMHAYSGQVWKVTLPGGEVLEVADSGETDTTPGERGRIRYRVDASKGSSSLESIRGVLREMGLEMREAETADLELTYWRSMTHVLAGRPDFKSSTYAPVWASLKAFAEAHDIKTPALSSQASAHKVASAISEAGLPGPDEADAWRQAWATVVGQPVVDEWVDKQRYLPRLSHFDPTAPEVTSGKPFFYRVEAAVHQPAIDGHWGFLSHSNYGGHTVAVVKSGVLAGTEARLRILGIWQTGQSSPEDLVVGGAGTVFMHPSGYGAGDYLISPRVLARTSTYGSDHDFYGSLAKRAHDSTFSLEASRHLSNQQCAKDALSLLDDLELVKAGSESQRSQLIKFLKDHGVTSIRGVPVEDRIVTSFSPFRDKVRTALKAEDGRWLDPPPDEDIYVAPPSPLVEHAVITTEAAEEAAEAAGHGVDVSAVAGAQVYAPSDAPGHASQATVKEVFTGGQSQTDSQVKHEMAERVAGAMPESDHQALADMLHDGQVNLSTEPSWGETPEARAIAGLIKTWAQGNSAPITLAMQDLAHDVFGLPKEALPPLGYASSEQIADSKAIAEKYGPALIDFLTTMWSLTQSDLGEAGIENVTLYRVMRWNQLPDWAQGLHDGDEVDVPQARPLASYAYTQGGATGAGTFTGGSHTVLIKTVVPRELLLSMPRTGFGCYHEHEFVAMDSPGKWEVVSVS